MLMLRPAAATTLQEFYSETMRACGLPDIEP